MIAGTLKSGRITFSILLLICLGYVSITQHHLLHQLLQHAIPASELNHIQAPLPDNADDTPYNVNESCLHCTLSHFISADIPPPASLEQPLSFEIHVVSPRLPSLQKQFDNSPSRAPPAAYLI